MIGKTSLGKLIENAKRLSSSDILMRVFFDELTLAEMADMNTEQLNSSKYSDGSTTDEYSAYTSSLKKIKGQPSIYMTFKDTGAFHESIRYDLQNSSVVAKFNDVHDLLLNYSDKIIGITPQNRLILKDEIIETFQKTLTK